MQRDTLTYGIVLGSPGADRIVINKNCERAGEITHTGAGGNKFVGCQGTE
jgi:hypothetical protein